MKPKARFTYAAHFKLMKKKIKFLVHDCFVGSFHSVFEYFVSRSFKFGIHQDYTEVILSLEQVQTDIEIISLYIYLKQSRTLENRKPEQFFPSARERMNILLLERANT